MKIKFHVSRIINPSVSTVITQSHHAALVSRLDSKRSKAQWDLVLVEGVQVDIVGDIGEVDVIISTVQVVRDIGLAIVVVIWVHSVENPIVIVVLIHIVGLPVVVLIVFKVDSTSFLVDVVDDLAAVEVVSNIWLAVVIVIWIYIVQDSVVVVVVIDVVRLPVVVFVVFKVYSTSFLIDVVDDLSYNGHVVRDGELRWAPPQRASLIVAELTELYWRGDGSCHKRDKNDCRLHFAGLWGQRKFLGRMRQEMVQKY